MSRPSAKNSKVRFNLELSESTARALAQLQLRTDAESKTEVIRRALALYDAIWRLKENGGETVLRTRDGKERIILLT